MTVTSLVAVVARNTAKIIKNGLKTVLHLCLVKSIVKNRVGKLKLG